MPHISRHQTDKEINFEPPKLRLYQLTKVLAAEISPHIYSSLRDLCVIIETIILSISTKLADVDPTGTLDSLSEKKTNRKIHRI